MIDTSKHEGLQAVQGFPFPVHTSPGLETRGRSIAERCARAYRFLSKVLDFEPKASLLVLSPQDWSGRSSHPVYGMPNYEAGNLIVAGEESSFWGSFVDMIKDASPSLLKEAQATYGSGERIDLAPFFDLLVVHELAHIFHDQVPFHFPRAWLTEFFANLCLHAYVASVEPEQLSTLETFPRLIVALGPDKFRYRTLEAFEALYTKVGPQNYGWYQCRLHLAAKKVYDAEAISALQKLWKTFAITDPQLVESLKKIHPEMAKVLTGWSR